MTGPDPSKADRLSREQVEHEIAASTRTIVIGPYLTRRSQVSGPRGAGTAGPDPQTIRDPQTRLDEAIGLAAAIDLPVVSSHLIQVAAPRPSTFLGKGRVEELAGLVAAEEAGLVVMDCGLSPVQQRNLERAWGVKVIDRTGLILEIFGRRARTREGTLQVELAHLAYQKSRLVRSWTHLERQRGGFGFLGGPGETQIEADRRIIQDRMRRLEKDLDGVKRTRGLHRDSRRRVPYPIVALVGYTNAGKSTLFNRLTAAEVLAQDLLFATLDPTTRAIALPHGQTAILADTVGFISDLPTMLVAAFRATLEDVIEADVLLHVRDISAPDSDAEARDVEEVLRQLGIDPADRGRILEVWNKADLLPEAERDRLAATIDRTAKDERPVLLSAVTGAGLDDLAAGLDERIAAGRPLYAVEIAPDDGSGLHWLYEEAEVIRREDGEGGASRITARVAPEKEGRFKHRFPGAEPLR